MLNPFLEHEIDSIILRVDSPSFQVLREGEEEDLFYRRHSKTIEIDILGFRRQNFCISFFPVTFVVYVALTQCSVFSWSPGDRTVPIILNKLSLVRHAIVF